MFETTQPGNIEGIQTPQLLLPALGGAGVALKNSAFGSGLPYLLLWDLGQTVKL